MENLTSWFHHQDHDQQSCNQNSLFPPIHTGLRDAVPTYMNSYSVEYSTIGSSPVFRRYVMQQFNADKLNDSGNWLPFLPCSQKHFASVPNPVSSGRVPTAPFENIRRKGGSDMDPRTSQKKFLVFDQAGGKTTLFYGSGLETPVKCTTFSRPKPSASYVLSKEEAWDARSPLGPMMNDEYIENNSKHEVKSEMHEDTEELNALLFSDGDGDCSEDGEETSTGHSPTSTVIHYHLPVSDDDGDAIRSDEPTKRQKLSNGSYNVPRLMHTEQTLKTSMSSELEDDAESSCGDANTQDSDYLGSIAGKKRSRKDEVLETLNILQKIIPGGKGKDATVVIDEAIHYLRSLKAKAKVLGLDTL